LTHATVLNIFLLAFCFFWAKFFNGQVAGANTIPWLCLMVMEFSLLFPSIRGSNSLDNARQQQLSAILHDPFCWIFIATLSYAGLQWINSGCQLEYHADNNSWNYSRTPLGYGPFSINSADSKSLFFLIMTVATILLALRHGITRKSRILLMQLLAANGAIMVLYGFVYTALVTLKFKENNGTNWFISNFGMGDYVGIYLAALFFVAGGLILHALNNPTKNKHFYWHLTVFLLTFTGAVFNIKNFSLAFFLFLSLPFVIYMLIYAWPRITLVARLKTFFLGFICISIAVAFVFYVFPDNHVRNNLMALDWNHFWRKVFSDLSIQRLTALNIWREYPWFGAGSMGYFHFHGMYIQPQQWGVILGDASRTYSDFLKVLSEHGLIGLCLFYSIPIIMLITIIKLIYVNYKNPYGRWDSDRVLFLRLSPVALTMLVALIYIFAHSLIDNPLTSTDILILVTIIFTCIPAFLTEESKPRAAKSIVKN